MSVKTSLHDRYSSHFSFNFMSLLEEMQIYSVLFKITNICAMHLFFHCVTYVLRLQKSRFYFKASWQVWFLMCGLISLKFLVAYEERILFLHISLRLGLFDNCLLGNSASEAAKTDSDSSCSQGEYFLL